MNILRVLGLVWFFSGVVGKLVFQAPELFFYTCMIIASVAGLINTAVDELKNQ